jgi:sugar O-acyltransferase (sialic acid O-acetyltransferase NeuD family)
MIIIGYSGHSFVVCDAMQMNQIAITGYCDSQEKPDNPFGLNYIGSEEGNDAQKKLATEGYFVSIGVNTVRGKVTEMLSEKIGRLPGIVIHPTAWVSPKAKLSAGTFVSANATINALAVLGKGVIANTACVIEHECIIGDYAHICPGTVLAGNVSVGAYSFIGANSVVKQGVRIGSNVIVGAGTVVIRDLPDNVCVAGNPAKIIKSLK